MLKQLLTKSSKVKKNYPRKDLHMREFMILIGELVLIAMVQVILDAILDESGQKRAIKVVNIACILISYFLLVRYVYNNLIGEFTTMINYHF
jgi:hypothetical protein